MIQNDPHILRLYFSFQLQLHFLLDDPRSAALLCCRDGSFADPAQPKTAGLYVSIWRGFWHQLSFPEIPSLISVISDVSSCIEAVSTTPLGNYQNGALQTGTRFRDAMLVAEQYDNNYYNTTGTEVRSAAARAWRMSKLKSFAVLYSSLLTA